jgi:microtubule-associated protein-like 6
LCLEFVHSYEGKVNTANNLFYNSLGDVVYYIASLGIVYNPTKHTQSFFKGHGNDIRCLAMDRQRRCKCC